MYKVASILVTRKMSCVTPRASSIRNQHKSSQQLIRFFVLYSGEKANRLYRCSSNASSSSTSSNKSGDGSMTCYGRKQNFTRHYGHRGDSTFSPQLSRLEAAHRSSAEANIDSCDLKGTVQYSSDSEGSVSSNPSRSSLLIASSARGEKIKAKIINKTAIKRNNKCPNDQNDESDASGDTMQPPQKGTSSTTGIMSQKLKRVDSLTMKQRTVQSPFLRHRKSNEARPVLSRKLSRQSSAASSDTDYQDGDALVPSVEAFLDNSKALGYSTSINDATDDSKPPVLVRQNTAVEKEALNEFKYEIVRLTHTLKIKGWRSVPMEKSAEIEVDRLSGALTNAVYVVSPPKDLPTPAEQFAASNTRPLKAMPA